MLNKIIRLNKFIAYSGICSRRKADELIILGLITVNNKIIKKLGYKINYKDIVKYNNKILSLSKFIYIILNKPKKCITTVKDNCNRPTIMSYLPIIYTKKYRIYPVGRLDYNTTGILLLTNDGMLCNFLLHPKKKIKKTYKVILNKKITTNNLILLKKGIKLKEGKIKIKNIYIIKSNKNIIYLTIYLGWNRVIHRIFNYIGYKVLSLKRINFAGLKINKYINKQGKYKIISQKYIYNKLKIKI